MASFVASLFLDRPVIAAPPTAVSPGGNPGALIQSRCPTFSWSGIEGATGYEIALYRVESVSHAPGETPDPPEPSFLTRVSLPARATTWTPSLGQCLEWGGSYAWSIRALEAGEAGAWSEANLFQVAGAPSLVEVEVAIETLKRYLAEVREDESPAPELTRGVEPVGDARALETGSSTVPLVSQLPSQGPASQPGESIRSVSAASAPTLGAPSLTVDANVALGAASNLFKEGSVFLWDDTTGNTALGRQALSSATGTATSNTAVGRNALQNTAEGYYPFDSSSNTALGDSALAANTDGRLNTATGAGALRSNTSGIDNTASGVGALFGNDIGSWNVAIGNGALSNNTIGHENTAIGYGSLSLNSGGDRNTGCGYKSLFSVTGSFNTALGARAGNDATDGDSNIFIGYGVTGIAGEANTIRLGQDTGTGIGQQNRTFIAGIYGTTTGVADAINVFIDSSGQLGTTSSSRTVKRDIRDVGELSKRLLELRPVAFRYKVHAEDDPETPLQFGLIAEEVAKTFPELVVYDEKGRPQTVKYHLLASLLLNELQREDREVEQAFELQQRELAALRERLAALERGERLDSVRTPWWRRLTDKDRASP